MKFLIVLCSLTIASMASAKSLCGHATGFSFNQDTIKRPYQLSGFWVKQNTEDIRITYGNSPELIDFVETLDGNIFVCLDEYKLVKKTYSGRPRTYAQVQKFRVWLDGKRVFLNPEAGVLFQGEPLTTRAVAENFFRELKLAEEDDRDVDICYFGDWEKAVSAVHNVISILVYDIYGESEGAPLDVEVLNNDSGESTYGIISGC